jgi:lysophospholipase L1-like esterase
MWLHYYQDRMSDRSAVDMNCARESGVQMSAAESLIRGQLTADGANPRATPHVLERLPRDTGQTSEISAGVRLELTGDASSVEISYELGASNPFANPAAAAEAVVYVDTAAVSSVPLVEGRGTVRVALPPRDPQTRVRVYLPETGTIRVADVEPSGGTIEPPPARPRWVVYGDSITQGWSVTAPGSSFASRVARDLDLDLINLGFAGSARGELPTAQLVAHARPDLVTLAWGTNCWSQIPVDGEYIRALTGMYLRALRWSLPGTPILVLSPIIRPAAEGTANAVGATLAELREGVESAVSDQLEHDPAQRLALLPGMDLVSAEQLVDGIHPDDAGHAAMASAITERLRPWLENEPSS